MRYPVVALFWASLVSAQVDYPDLDPEFLLTSIPITPLPQGFPWGDKTVNNTNVYPPLTGVIRNYDFTIERETKAPDGYSKPVLIINGQFPAPLIEANWGDTIQVTVHNQITGPEEGTALHWHGLLQKGNQWEDGVPGVSMCPIPPGGSFTYSFIADLYGSSWYHSHYSAQYAGGLIGPMIIHGPNTVKYDIDKGPILLTDWFHRDYNDIVEDIVGKNKTKTAPASDSNLINGRNNFDCSTVAAGDETSCKSNAGITNFLFTPGKLHRLRLINAGAEGVQKFSIDGHNMTVIANDFVPIIPYDTKVVSLAVGQRTDVLVRGLDGATGAYIMRSSIASAPCSFSSNPDATAIVYYNNDTLTAETSNTTAWPEFNASVANACVNDDLTKTVPWYPIAPDPNPPVTKVIDIDFHQNETGNWLWFMNNVSFRANYNQPVLLLSNMGNNSYPDSPEWNVENFGSNSSVRIVINNNGAAGFLAHPIHLHGHDMFVLDVGTGTWDGSTVVNPSNPQRRDVQILPANGYMVLQFTADNPGAWPLHCHIAWHVSAGLYVTVLERPDDIANLQIPSVVAQTCRDWSAFTNTTVLDQIDSGL
ncbi:oxidoreductase [Lachnellula willkommii]|uniref:Oxidoreductase n=1 Tax=Lachnellula willkommii TaxID=215461 RepID=A0A559MAP7_9HELO|nr:oxidoreductase [Lachnellula willkommii]